MNTEPPKEAYPLADQLELAAKGNELILKLGAWYADGMSNPWQLRAFDLDENWVRLHSPNGEIRKRTHESFNLFYDFLTAGGDSEEATA